MHRRITPLTACLLLLPALSADAQVYPERVRALTRGAGERVERYQREDRRATETERITRTVRLGPAGDVQISNIAGDITITRGGGNDVVVEAIKTSRSRTAEEAKAALPLVEVEITERAGRVDIRARYPRNSEGQRRDRNLNVSVAFNITAPERARISLNTISGDVSVSDIKGDLSLETISGAVRIGNAGRVSRAKTVSGAVEITDTAVEGAMDASTISGTVLLRNVKAAQMDLGSISGDITIDRVQCERVDAQSISGTIVLTGSLVRGGRYDLGSHSGQVQVNVTGETGFELEATSFSGSVRSEVPLTPSGVSQANNRGRQRALRGIFGDGSASLDITTFSGSVLITKK